MLIGMCGKCLEIKPLTKHYISQEFNAPVLFLCSECQKAIKIFLGDEKLNEEEYLIKTKAFLANRGKCSIWKGIYYFWD